MKMGNLISTFCFNSKETSVARINDSSTWYPQLGQHISIRTFRELNPAPTSNLTSTKTEILSNGVNSRSTEEVLEAASRQVTTLPQKH
uniref:Putative AC4 protein n=1 Tax=Tomato chlorotic vein virus TaxID=172390 RepID=Q8QPV2_9GEMI|nr:putative AC4 protein [Tomato chlorotic vein virus]